MDQTFRVLQEALCEALCRDGNVYSMLVIKLCLALVHEATELRSWPRLEDLPCAGQR